MRTLIVLKPCKFNASIAPVTTEKLSLRQILAHFSPLSLPHIVPAALQTGLSLAPTLNGSRRKLLQVTVQITVISVIRECVDDRFVSVLSSEGGAGPR